MCIRIGIYLITVQWSYSCGDKIAKIPEWTLNVKTANKVTVRRNLRNDPKQQESVSSKLEPTPTFYHIEHDSLTKSVWNMVKIPMEINQDSHRTEDKMVT